MGMNWMHTIKAVKLRERARIYIMAAVLASALMSAACDTATMRRPSSNPAKMSSDTLCYRAATAKKDEAVIDEIRARHLNCDAVLENDPLLNGSRY